MACNKPFLKRNKDGIYQSLPCGYCCACRRDRLTMWSDRLQFEIMTSERKAGMFVTLTYEDRFLPSDGSVRKEHAHKFIKDFRHAYDTRYGRTVRINNKGEFINSSKFKYFLVSEYGELGRPHYHAIITSADCMENTALVREVWHKGFVRVLPANPSTIRYVLKYISKQEHKEEFYNPLTGAVCEPNFVMMSNGIGRDYLFRNANYIRKNHGYLKGTILRPIPRYYKKLLNLQNKEKDYSKEYARIEQYLEGRDLSHFDDVGFDRAAFVRNEVTGFYGNAKDIAMKTQEELKVKLW